MNHDDLIFEKASDWWRFCPDEDPLARVKVANTITATVNTIENNQGSRRQEYEAFASLYLNQENFSFDGSSLIIGENPLLRPVNFRDMTFNISQSCVDTICSKVAKSKIRLFYLTSQGDLDQQERALYLTSYNDYVTDRTKLYKKAQSAFRDACIYGTGVLKVFTLNNQIAVEQVNPADIRVDEIEATDGEPEQLHHVRLISRTKLRAMYPDFDEQLKTEGNDDRGITTISERIKVIESWHLPSTAKGSDGWRVVSVANTGLVLECESYTYSRFPFAFIRWSNPLQGFFGNGLVKQLSGIQREINDTIERIRDAIRFSVPRVFLQGDTTLDETELNDLIGAIIRYQGQNPPVISTPSTVSGDTFHYLNDLYNKGYEISGISVLSAASKKPAGIDSGAALAEYQDIESERFELIGQAWENLFLDVGELVLEYSRAMYSNKSKINLLTSDKKFLERKFWQDIDLPEEDVQLAVFPAPLVPRTPAGQIQMAMNMSQMGVSTPDQTRAALRLPDADRDLRDLTAPLRAAKRIVQNVLTKGKVFKPNQYLDLTSLAKVAAQAYNDAIASDLYSENEENLDLLLQLMDEVGDMLNPQPEQMPPPANDNGAPLPEGSPQPEEQLPPPTGMPPQAA